MTTALIPFDFETNAVRSVAIDGLPWFVAADVCRVLGIRNTSQALHPLDDDQKGVCQIYTLGGEQAMSVVNQSGLLTLISRSDKPVAKRFMRWIFDTVIPALIRDGYYVMPGVQGAVSADLAELAAKRAYYDTLPPAHREQAEARAAMVAEVERLIGDGWLVGAAVAAVAEANGVSVRTVYNARRAVYMVANRDRPAALARRWSGKRGMIAACHPLALERFTGLVRAGARIRHAYQQMAETAAAEGWEPIPCERTLRRAVQDAGARGLIQIGRIA